MKTIAHRRAVAIAAVVLASIAAVHPQPVRPSAPTLVITSMDGRDLYQFYCASCHGCDAKGAGPVAAALKSAPSDLTRIASGHGGVFPRESVASLVAGRRRTVAAHGSDEMPVWGPVFRGLDSRAGYDEARIANIVSYLESIQGKSPRGDCR